MIRRTNAQGCHMLSDPGASKAITAKPAIINHGNSDSAWMD